MTIQTFQTFQIYINMYKLYYSLNMQQLRFAFSWKNSCKAQSIGGNRISAIALHVLCGSRDEKGKLHSNFKAHNNKISKINAAIGCSRWVGNNHTNDKAHNTISKINVLSWWKFPQSFSLGSEMLKLHIIICTAKCTDCLWGMYAKRFKSCWSD